MSDIQLNSIKCGAYVYVFKMNLKPEEYGLDIPPSLTEGKNIIRLTESQFRQILVESISAVLNLNEEKCKKKVGDYTALDGQWMLMVYDGIENKGRVQDIRMYDNDLFRGKENFDTILLFRRQDNLKFFYARIVPVGEHGVKFESIPLKDVPKIIKDDFKTINPLGRVPYRVH